MSELKAYIVYLSSEGVLGLWKSYSIRIEGAEVYLKSEADKVIAEKDAEIERLRGESCKLTDGCLRLKQCRKEKANIADKLRHSNHKRCLAMAEWCKARYDEEDAELNRWASSWDYVSKEMKYWERWQWRWLELAEEPTWARFLQLICKEAK